LPKEVVDAPSLEALKAACGSGQPGLVVGDPARSRGLKRDDHRGPFQPTPLYDSIILYSYNSNKTAQLQSTNITHTARETKKTLNPKIYIKFRFKIHIKD